ncbi:hypothetical protein PROFUN_04144 [Planoprotostelium fungivorum]|uniref:Cilia- and flagella-associated protein 299 n=1 Tax=Planoprotostelium fungivorum TaxID=1890364 RepID=A0A2P6NJK8_9EUKA|nr:hypothetical protein PROFUN_04144 [Planoprotostelium fungivorum]
MMTRAPTTRAALGVEVERSAGIKRHPQHGDSSTADAIVAEYATYEEYLDSQISAKDLYYLEDEDLARQLVELGYRGGELKREEFDQRKRNAESLKSKKSSNLLPRALASTGKDLSSSPFLSALAEREDQCIIFIRDKNKKGQEVSGYIDYAERLKTENFENYFSRRKRLLPKPTDLSFYNWETQTPSSNPTSNFQIIASNPDPKAEPGLLFKNKRDRKVINVDPKADPGDNSRRIEIKTDEYVQVVIYDHTTRRKT